MADNKGPLGPTPDMPEPDVGKINAELAYLRGAIDAMRTAPGSVDVTAFLDRFGRALAALEAVTNKSAGWAAVVPKKPTDELAPIVFAMTKGLGKILLDIISKDLLGEEPDSG